jgi:hypothetical protein
LLAEGAQALGVVAFGEAGAGGVFDQRAVTELRSGQAEGAIQQQLARGGAQQVFAANHFRDAHGGVIHHDGQLVRGRIVETPDNEVAKVLAGDELLRAA